MLPSVIAAVATSSGPKCTVAPVVSGDTWPGALLTVSPGTWTKGTPTRQWYRRTLPDGDPVAISGATGLTLVSTDADAAKTVTCVETVGGVSQASNGIAVAYEEAVIDLISRAANSATPVTDAQARRDLNDVVLGLEDLGFNVADWIFTPCRAVVGGLNYFGGWTTNASNSALSGDAALGTHGITLGAWHTDYANYVTPPRPLTAADQDYAWFVVSSQSTTDPCPPASTYLPTVANANSAEWNLPVRVFTANPTSEPVHHHQGFFAFQQEADYVTLFTSNIGWKAHARFRTNYKFPMMFGGFNRATQGTCWALVSQIETVVANQTPTVFTTPRFTAPVQMSGGGSGTIHGIAAWKGDPTAIRATTRRLWALFSSTIFRFGTRQFFVNVHVAGQSNGGGSLQPLQLAFDGDYRGPVTVTCHQIGGTSIASTTLVGGYKTGWVDNLTYAKGYYYTLGIAPFVQSRPVKNRGKYKNVFVWVQGESGTESASACAAYQAYEEALFDNVCDDLGDDCYFIIALIDYHRTYRDASEAEAVTNGAQANFSLSALTGTTSVLNGTWQCQALSEEDTGWELDANGNVIQSVVQNYEWRITGHKLRRRNDRWEFTRDTDETVIAYADNNLAHPYLATSWTLPLGAGSQPTIPFTRTAGIEYMRHVKRTHAATNPTRYKTVDLRGCEYAATNAAGYRVHLTATGHTHAAARYAACIDALT